MTSLINADTSNGLKLTSDTSGNLDLQSAGTTKVAVTSSGASVTGDIALSSHLDMTDSGIIKLGSDDDLLIKHDGTNGSIVNSTGDLYLSDAGGNIYIQAKTGEQSIAAFADGAVDLYHNNVKKLATQAIGVNLTGAQVGGAGAVASTGSWTGSDGVIFHTSSPSLNLASYGVLVSHTYRGVFFTNSLWNVYDESNVGVHLVGGATSWTANSDERIKENITELNGSTAYNHVKAARAVTFNWKQAAHNAKAGKKIGFIAQDWETAYPEVVDESLASPQIAEEIDGIEADTQIKGMQYTETIPVLMAALKEAIAKIEVLETKVAALEA